MPKRKMTENLQTEYDKACNDLLIEFREYLETSAPDLVELLKSKEELKQTPKRKMTDEEFKSIFGVGGQINKDQKAFIGLMHFYKGWKEWLRDNLFTDAEIEALIGMRDTKHKKSFSNFY